MLPATGGFAACYRRQARCLSTLLHEIAQVVDMGCEVGREGKLVDYRLRQAHNPIFSPILLQLIRSSGSSADAFPG